VRIPLFTVIVTIASFGVVLAGTVDVYSVTGRSMEPVIVSGQIVVVDRISYRIRAPRRGEILVIREPVQDRLVLKQCIRVDENMLVYVRGINSAASIDSRSYGGVQRTRIRGRVVLIGGHRNG